MSVDTPAFYFHRKPNGKPGFQRQSGEAVRARAREVYRLDPAKAKAINAAWYAAHPEKRREYVSIWWQRHKDEPRVREANRLKCQLQRLRKRIKRAWESLMIV